MTAAWLVLAGLLAAPAPSVDEATALLDSWQLEDAMAQAADLLAADPAAADRQALAGEVLHQRGDHLQALALLRAVDDRPAGERLRAIGGLVRASAAYAAAFEVRRTPHFRLLFVDKDAVLAAYAEPVLEAAYARIGADLGLLPAERGEPIAVEIYPDARGLAGATGLTLKEIETSGTIAVCKFHRLMITSPLATADGYGWADTLAHEFTHLVVSKRSRNRVPIWLHEGIAKYYESRWKGPAGTALSPYAEGLLARALRKDSFITFAQMHPSMAKLPSQDDAALAFAEVFTVIEYLDHRFGAGAIAALLGRLGAGVPLEAALQEGFGMGLTALEGAWKRSLAQRAWRPAAPGAAPPKLRLVGPGADPSGAAAAAERPLEEMADRPVHDAARLGELLQLRGQPRAAVVEYERALAAGGLRYGTLVARLGRAYVALERPDDALALVQRGLALRPDDAEAHLLAGRLQARRGEAAAARHHYEAVRLQNPYNPEVHVALTALLRQAGEGAAADAEAALGRLCEAPRPRRAFEVPAAPRGAAYVTAISVPWGEVTLDGGPPLRTPAWDLPVAVGRHTLRRPQDGAGGAAVTVAVAAQEHATALLRASPSVAPAGTAR